MRFLKKHIDNKKHTASLMILPECDDDFYHIYNLLQTHDVIKTATYRKIGRETNTGSKTNEKRRILVTLKVTEVTYYSDKYLHITIKGKNCVESNYLALGQFHTVELEVNIPISIYKSNWDQLHSRYLKSIQEQPQPTLYVLIMEEGVAHLVAITSYTSILKRKVQINIPKKKHSIQHVKSLNNFYNQTMLMLHHENILPSIKTLILASPGFVKNEFYTYLKENTDLDIYRESIFKHLNNKFVLVSSSTGYLQSIDEIMSNKNILSVVENSGCAEQQKLIDEFFEQLRKDSSKVVYGLKEVQYAIEIHLLDKLLITDSLIRTKKIDQRKFFINLVQQAKAQGAIVVEYSSQHSTGTQLKAMGGFAGLTRESIKLDNLEEEESSSEDEGESVISENIDETDLQQIQDHNFDDFM